MKKIIAITCVCVFAMNIAHGQTMTKKDARQLLEKAWSYLKTSDTASFINLWQPDNSSSTAHQQPYTRQEIKNDFSQLQDFLDTAWAQNLIIDNIEIEKDNLKNTDTEYWIKAWFKYDEHHYKGFGFYVAHKNNMWVVRQSPTSSARQRN